jgi:hypothetical protein
MVIAPTFVLLSLILKPAQSEQSEQSGTNYQMNIKE